MNPNPAIILNSRDAARGFRNVLRQAFCLAALFLSLASAGPIHAQAGLGETWEWRNPLPQGFLSLYAMAESDGNLIAVGRAGTVLTTTDGMSWTPRVSSTRNNLRAVAASGATVVAVGGEGDIVTSADGGLTWRLRFNSGVWWNTVIHGGGVWVATGYSTGGSSRTVMTSPDGLTWTVATVPNSSGEAYTCAVWTGLRFVLGGFSRLDTSEDGITWTEHTTDLWVRGLAWTGSRVVAVGLNRTFNGADIFISPDGVAWTGALTPEPGSPSISLTGVVWTGAQLLAWNYRSNVAYTSPTGETWTRRVLSTNGVFYPHAAAGIGTSLLVGGDRGLMVHSPDSGVTWSPVSSGVEGNLNAITRFAGRWVAAGDDGSLTSSADGVTWTPASSGTISTLLDIAWHDGLWVAVGGSVLTSTDGVTWTDRTSGSPVLSGRYISSVIHAGSQWVATASYAVLTSPDGITWQERPVGQLNSAVAWNGSRLIVVGRFEDAADNDIMRAHLSDDGGVTWTTQSFGAGELSGIAWTGSQFVMVGQYGRIFSSPTGDAGTWTSQTSGTGRILNGVMAEGGVLVAVGGEDDEGPVILTSPDGVTWTPRTAPTSRGLNSITKAGSLYVATGYYDGVVLTSPDAVTWTARSTPTTNALLAAAWDGTQLLVAGVAGTILASTGPSLKWKSVVRLPGINIGVRLTWFSTAGRIYDIESTTTLAPPWLPIPGSPPTATGPEEFIDFTEPGPSAASRRFFRVRERP